MFTIKVDTTPIKRALDELARELRDAADRAAFDASRAAVVTAKNAIRAQTRRRTGKLLAGTDSALAGRGRARFFSRAAYASFIDSGTAPHVIAARNAQALRFTMNGQVMFRRSVQHPGTSPRPFIEAARAAGERSLGGILRILTNEAIQRFERA